MLESAIPRQTSPSWRVRVRESLGVVRAWLAGDAATPWRWVLGAGAGLALVGVLGNGPLLRWVTAKGWELREANVALDWLLGVAWALALGAALAWIPLPRNHRRPLLVAWAAKVVVALGFMLVYEAHYGTELDAMSYFVHSNPDVFVWQGFQLNHGTETITTLAWLQGLVLPRSYHALKITFAMVGLIGIYLFYRAFALFLQRDQPVFLLFLALFPSVLFWSSILGKDPAVLAALGACAWGIVGLWRSRPARPRYLAGVGAGLVVLLFIRSWFIPILVLATSPLFLVEARWFLRARGLSPRATQAVLAIGLAVIAVGSAALLAQLFGLTSLAETFSFVNSLARSWAEGGSGQQPPEFRTVRDMIVFLPKGAFTALFRPLPGEITRPLLFGTLAGLENAFLLALASLAWRRARRADLRDPLVVAGLCFLLVWTVFYAFVSYQNLGSAERFRLQVLPVMLGLLVFLARPRGERAGTLAAWLPGWGQRLLGVERERVSFAVIEREAPPLPPPP